MGKARQLAAKLIGKDKGDLTASDLLRIKNKIKEKTGKTLSLKRLSKVAENKTDKTIDQSVIDKFKIKKLATKLIEKDKDDLTASDLIRIQNKIEKKTGSTLNFRKIAKLADKRTDKTIDQSVINEAKTQKKVGKSEDVADDAAEDVADEAAEDVADEAAEDVADEAASEVKPFPGADGKKVKGKDFRKYKPQSEEIREAKEAELAARLEKARAKPKKSQKVKDLSSEFSIGRQRRKGKLDKIGDAEPPKFEEYEQEVQDIRDNKGAAQDYAYSGKFKKLGATLGVKYGKKARKNRTKDRLASLRKGLKSERLGKTYEDAAESSATQQRRGRRAMKLFRGESTE
jgi:hypothetical protein